MFGMVRMQWMVWVLRMFGVITATRIDVATVAAIFIPVRHIFPQTPFFKAVERTPVVADDGLAPVFERHSPLGRGHVHDYRPGNDAG
jgi:hypothetical protein